MSVTEYMRTLISNAPSTRGTSDEAVRDCQLFPDRSDVQIRVTKQ